MADYKKTLKKIFRCVLCVLCALRGKRIYG
jgi:hypothetical protein